MVEPDRTHMAVWCMRFACWISKATDTCSEYAILIALATMVTRMCLSIWFVSTLPVLFHPATIPTFFHVLATDHLVESQSSHIEESVNSCQLPEFQSVSLNPCKFFMFQSLPNMQCVL